ncbi:MAG: ammonium transporter [Planctomycetes bacterium]|nr:ammonium transporter [Planctomycetota bacterium]
MRDLSMFHSARAALIAATCSLAFSATSALAQAPAGGEPAATPEVVAPTTFDKGDNAWMLVSCALVLFMTAPGLAMFYGGLVRKKNVLGVIMQCLFLMGLMTVLWATYGYSLAFGGSEKWIGTGEYLFMKNVEPYLENGVVTYPLEYVQDPKTGAVLFVMPRLTHMLFQGMFFIITPALICGAFAERMKFSTMVVFSILWGTLVYCPLCHAVWDGGLLAYDFVTFEKSTHAVAGALDFAGGTVVHISSGISALICALVIGKRLGFGHEPMPPHNLTYTCLGAAMLWVGWFGFNAGSALSAGGGASGAFANTHFAAAAGALAWPMLEWILRGKPTVLGTASGAVAGLVCITPAAGFVQPMSAIFMGLAAGAVCYFACTTIKNKFKYDDSLDAFGVHGVGGTLGAILTGVFATRVVVGCPEPLGLLEGGGLVTAQAIATGISIAFAAVLTFVLLKVLDLTMGLRVDQKAEVQGLDYSQHGEEGYIFL